MKRRDFLTLTSAAMVSLAMDRAAFALTSDKQSDHIDADWYRRSRRFANLPMCRLAYVERGHGPAALFLHGLPLNGYQWRGALERLHRYRRCIAPDFMSMGYTETPEAQAITPETQVSMLASLLDMLP